MKRSLVPVVLVVLGVVAIGGCGNDEEGVDVGDGESGPRRGRTYLSESVLESGVDRPLVDGTVIRLSFGDDDTIGANAGCNSMSGPVTITGDRLLVGDLSTTDMGCDPGRHEQDDWLAGFLAAGPSWSLDGDRLRLESGETVVVLVDREVADPDRPLVGTVWRLDGFVDGDVASSVPDAAAASLRFTGSAVEITVEGCNQGSAPVTIGESTVRIDEAPTMTLIACPEPLAEVEATVLAVLDGAIAYEIEAGSLTLSHPSGRGLTLRADEV